MTEADVRCSKEEISKKYPRGSPDYPEHAEGCGCSGCCASWGEWRAGHMYYTLGVQAAAVIVEPHPKELALQVLNLVSG